MTRKINFYCLLVFIFFLFSGCSNKSQTVSRLSETKDTGKMESLAKEKPMENHEQSQKDAEYDGSFIVEECDEYYQSHSFLAEYTLPGRVIDSICMLAMEYSERYGEVPNSLENLYAEELKNPKTYLKYALDLQKESDKKAFITISYGINEDKTYTVIYERKAQHVFSVYCDSELEYTIYRDGNSVHTEYIN